MPTVAELREKCKQLGLKGYSKLKKAELERLITLSPEPEVKPKKLKKKKAECTEQNMEWVTGKGCFETKSSTDQVYDIKIAEKWLSILLKNSDTLNDPAVKAQMEKILSKEIVADGFFSVLDALYTRVHMLKNARDLNLYINHIHHYLPLEDIKHIAAMAFYKYKLGDKTFFLIGENHANLGICDPGKQNIVFITGLVRAVTEYFKDRTYDFFTEMPYLKYGTNHFIGRFQESIGFNLISEQYKHCLDIGKPRKCGDNLRVHYTDYRETIADNYKFYTSAAYNSEVKSYIAKYLTSDKLKKQFLAIKDKKLPEKIYNWFLDNMSKKITDHRAISLVMDMYAAARMFRNFGDYSAKNIIYYAGVTHTRNMAELLRHLGAVEEIGADNFSENISSCIELDDPIKIFT